MEPFEVTTLVNPRNTYIPVRRGLVHSYLFNGDATDSTGSNDGTVNFATLTTNRFGDSNEAYEYTGSDDLNPISATSVSFITPTDEFSLSLLIKPSTLSSNQVIIESSLGTSNRFGIMIDTVGKIRSGLYNGSTYINEMRASSSSSKIVVDKWQHIVYVWDKTQARIYIDNVYYTGLETPFLSGQVLLSFFGKTSIGNDYIGKMDDVFIYNSALTADEVKALYEGYKPNFNEAKENFLAAQGFSSEVQYLQSELSSSLANPTDLWYQWFAAQGYTAGSLSDRWYQYLGASGYAGSLRERQKKYFEDNS